MGADIALSNDQMRDLTRALEDRYGIRAADLVRLGGELDANFSAVTAEGIRWFVRVTPAPFDLAAIEWQNAVLEQLSRRPLSVAVPRLVPSVDGTVMSEIDIDADAGPGMLRVTTWVSGFTVADLGETDPDFRRQLGALAAEVIESLSPLNDGQEDRNAHHWMVVKSGDSIRATMDAVEDPARRALLEAALARFEAVEDRIAQLPRTVVHQDLHDFNLLAERDSAGTASISGIVDFNDAVHTVRIAELAVAAVYSGLRQDDAFEAFTQVVEGYLSRGRLTDAELDLLFPLAVARLAVNASTWTARGKVGNTAYAKSRIAATWPALGQLLRTEPEHAARTFRNLRDGHAAAQRRPPEAGQAEPRERTI